MTLLTYDELRERLVAECRSRKWRPPSRRRLKKLRDTGQLPKATPLYEKGKRGRSWRYDPKTVPAYIRTEELRRASGKRVRSWKVIAQREQAQVVRAWLAQPEAPVPREVIADSLEEFAALLRRLSAAVYSYVEHPVGPLDDDRIEGAHTAIESMLAASSLSDEWRPAAEAVLQILMFRDEEGHAEDFDLPELLAPIRQRAGPFAAIGGVVGIRRIVADIPINDLLTHPRKLIEAVSDEEFCDSVRMTVGLFSVIERVAKVADVVRAFVEKAKTDARVRGDVRVDWCKPIVEGATAITKFLQSDLAPTLICASALVNVWLIRRKPGTRDDANMMMGNIANFASVVENSSFAKRKPAAALKS